MPNNEYLFSCFIKFFHERKKFLQYVNKDLTTNYLDNSKIITKFEQYKSLLSKYKSKICIIYHEIDEDFFGFVFAAFYCSVKILIRRTSVISDSFFYEDLSNIGECVPFELIFTNYIEPYEFEKIDNKIYSVKDSKEFSLQQSEIEYDFIQISSGTTSAPKAFCLTLEGLIKSAEHIADIQHVDSNSILFSYLTFSHIYGFVSGFILPIITGARCIYSNTVQIKENTDFLFDSITKFRITHVSLIINTIERALANAKNVWDLASLQCASLGGERVEYEIFKRLQDKMCNYGMDSKVLVNSYGMSEKGSITMENPYIGNYLLYKDNSGFVSVGDSKYADVTSIIVDENSKILNDNIKGRILFNSNYISKMFYCNRQLQPVSFYQIEGKNYYSNGDYGFISNGKLFVTGRIVNTITFNGLKIDGESLNEFIRKELENNELSVSKVYCFNYTPINNHVVCFINSESPINKKILSKVSEKVKYQFHIIFADYLIKKYDGQGLEKISLSILHNMYSDRIIKL